MNGTNSILKATSDALWERLLLEQSTQKFIDLENPKKLQEYFNSFIGETKLRGSFDKIKSLLISSKRLISEGSSYILFINEEWYMKRKDTLMKEKSKRSLIEQGKGNVDIVPEVIPFHLDSAGGSLKVTVGDNHVQAITVHNRSDKSHLLTSIVILPGPNSTYFNILDTSDRRLPMNIPAMSTCIIRIRFMPKRAGTFKAVLSVNFSGFSIGRYLTGCSSLNSAAAELLAPTAPFVSASRNKKKSIITKQSEVVEPEPKSGKSKGSKRPRKLRQYPVTREWDQKNELGEAEVDLQKLQSNMYNTHSYRSLFHALLWVEEIQKVKNMRDYGIEKAVLVRTNGGLFRLQVPGLAESRPSLITGDKVLVKKESSTNTLYAGEVEQVEQTAVLLRFHSSFGKAFSERQFYDVQFKLNRKMLRVSHQAIDQVINATYFNSWLGSSALTSAVEQMLQSDPSSRLGVTAATPLHSLQTTAHNKSLNFEQLRAVHEIRNGTDGDSAYIIFGPPGTGKSATIVETALQLLSHKPKRRILLCAPTNAAADLLTQRLSAGLQSIGNSSFDPKKRMFRLMAYFTDLASVPEDVLPYCRYDKKDEVFISPAVEELRNYSLVVGTCSMAGTLFNHGVNNDHFHYVFVDEAGRVTEPETVACFAGLLHPKEGRLILAGDPFQLGTVVHSNVAKTAGLGVSLLERLMMVTPTSTVEGINATTKRMLSKYSRHELYTDRSSETAYYSKYVTKLLQAYRCHPDIIHVSNSLFYGSELRPQITSNSPNSSFTAWPHLPTPGFPVIFDCIYGEETREANNPSWFNIEEAEVVLEWVRLVVNSNPSIKPSDVGVITPYRKQCAKIRTLLRQHGFDDVSVGSCEQFQGQERRVIIVSTVRSSSEHIASDGKFGIGFLASAKRFNVAATRAEALLIVVGNPRILSTDDCWGMLLAYCKSRSSCIGLAEESGDVTMEETEAIMRRLMDPGDKVNDASADDDITNQLRALNIKSDAEVNESWEIVGDSDFSD